MAAVDEKFIYACQKISDTKFKNSGISLAGVVHVT